MKNLITFNFIELIEYSTLAAEAYIAPVNSPSNMSSSGKSLLHLD